MGQNMEMTPLESFLVWLRAERRLSELTVLAYERDVRQLIEFTGGNPLTSALVRQHLKLLMQRLSPASIHRKVSAFKTFSRFCYQRGYAKENWGLLLKGPKVPLKLPEFLQVDEVAPFLSQTENVLQRALFELIYGSGLRISEALHMTWGDLEWEQGWVKVLGKGKKNRRVPVSRPALRALRALAHSKGLDPKDLSGDSRLVFLSRRGKPLQGRVVRRWMKEALQKAGIQNAVTVHGLRHSCATHLLDSGADIRVIQELLGHTSINTTQRYTHVSLDHLKRIIDTCHPLEKIK